MQPIGFVDNDTDCNDLDSLINPMALEILGNDIDENCNGLMDDSTVVSIWFADEDGDGFGNPDIDSSATMQPIGFVDNDTDCNDLDSLINPMGFGNP